MKKVLLFVHFILIAVATMHAQSLSEDFESGKFPPEGWTTRFIDYSSASNFPKWNLIEDSMIDTNVTGYKGGKVLVSQSSGYGTLAAWTSSWLITPQFTVGENEYLSFMLGANGSYNNLNGIDEPYKLTVMVSTTGNDSICFTDTIFKIIPKGVLPWGSYNIDMKKYEGKQVYVAFWDFGHTAGMLGAFLANRVYLDNIRTTQNPAPDLTLSSIGGIADGCQLEQALATTVRNTGLSISTYKLCYQIDEQAIVRQDVNEALGSGMEKEYVFTKKLNFNEPREQMDTVYHIKVWVEAPNDANLLNDTLTTAVSIVGSMEYPYKMTTEEATRYFRSSAPVGRQNSYWKWFSIGEGGEDCWLYSAYMTNPALLVSNCMVLPKGKVRVNFEYKCANSFKTTISLGNFNYSAYQMAGRSDQLPASPYEWAKAGVTVDVSELGKYSVGLTVDAASSQLLMRNIEICDPYNDVAAQRIISPYANAILKNSSVTVSATFKNIGKDDLQNVPVHYQLNGKVMNGTIATLLSGQEITYTFDAKADFSSLGSSELKVWSALESDGDKSNDETSVSVEVYEAAGFPYKMGFEPNENWKDWISYNPEKDIVYWGVSQVTSGGINYSKEGEYAAYINSFSGVTHDDWMISPAITLPKGKVRLSFYYTTLYATGVSNLKVYLGKTDYYADFESGILALTVPITNTKFYRQGYVLLDIEEAGNYYLAFYNEGSGRDIILDDVRLDEADDMAIDNISADAKNGFYLRDAEVTLSFMNHGLKTKSNISLSYTLYKDGTKDENIVQTVTETYIGSIEPGAAVNYVFGKKASVSTPGTYFISGEVKDASDSDNYNNKVFSSTSIVHYQPATLPYLGDFESDLERTQWIFGGGWATGSVFTAANSAYSGTGGIRHTGAASQEGDWAFSGCIEIPAGTYDFGFFYRTWLIVSGNPTPEKNGQNFEVFLGNAPSAGAMTLSVYKEDNALVPDRQYRKVVKTITIPADGHFYIGVKCTTTNTASSSLFMDCFTIKAPVTDGLSLEAEPYVADFANRESEWYHYNPSASHFEQWTVSKILDETFMKTKVDRDDKQQGLTYKPCPGAYVAPVMSLKRGDIIRATFDYSIIIKSSAPESMEQYIRLYMADRDMPDAFINLVATGDDNSGDRATVSGSITIPADGLYYFGYMVETPVSTQAFNLYTTKIEKTGTDPSVGMQNTESEDSGYYIQGSTLYLTGDFQHIRIYNGYGQLMFDGANTDKVALGTYQKGVYILSLTSGNIIKTGKFIIANS